MSTQNPILTAEQAADLFPRNGKNRSVSTSVICEAIRTGELAGKKIGNLYFTTEAAIIRWISGPLLAP